MFCNSSNKGILAKETSMANCANGKKQGPFISNSEGATAWQTVEAGRGSVERSTVDLRSPPCRDLKSDPLGAGSFSDATQQLNALATSALLTQEGRLVMSDADYYVSYSLFYNELAVELPSDLLSFSLLILKFDICTLSACLEMWSLLRLAIESIAAGCLITFFSTLNNRYCTFPLGKWTGGK